MPDEEIVTMTTLAGGTVYHCTKCGSESQNEGQINHLEGCPVENHD